MSIGRLASYAFVIVILLVIRPYGAAHDAASHVVFEGKPYLTYISELAVSIFRFSVPLLTLPL
jgi:hypothetical protein